MENERDHDAVRRGIVAVVLGDQNERTEGPGAAMVQMDVELTYQGT